jgi:hypothetical protein
MRGVACGFAVASVGVRVGMFGGAWGQGAGLEWRVGLASRECI